MRLALFDLDDTLLDGDCSDRWNLWMIEQGWIRDVDAFMVRAAQMQQAYHAGKLKLEEYLGMTLAPLRGRRVSDVQKEVERFVATHLEPRIFDQAWACLDAHRQAGDTLLLISASSRHLVEPIATTLGIEHVLAVEPSVEHGINEDARYTGGSEGVFSYRGGKVMRLKQWLAEQQITPSHTTFYSDSRNDLPLLQYVDCPVAVNPDPVLAEVASLEGWRRLDWRTTNPAVAFRQR
ncbi:MULTISPECIES: HAD-IB family hydrolase [unclassified Halomonas]|uniref:HAD family hydrolase n=1 Tax=unclassified Halomonas TaxID=2609666 RepID=UPI0018EFDAB4|nr:MULTISPECIES: HAD-IB family hydrolase [unclassified Halomonas]MCO7248016.1 HAD-IB family hydrolase [Halomonas sp. Mc5H-6]QPL45833.1 HAD-IB family hydrolase [Halomonas sp. A40-4]